MSSSHLLSENIIFSKIPYRDKEISLLAQLFSFLTNPSTPSYQKVLVSGKSGLFKTETVKEFLDYLKVSAKMLSVPLHSLYIDGADELIWDFQLSNNITLRNLPKKIRFLLVLDHLERVSISRLDKVMDITNKQNLSLIGIVNPERLHNFKNFLDLTGFEQIIEFSPFTEIQIIDFLHYYCNKKALSFSSSNIIKKIATQARGSMKNAICIINQAEKVIQQTEFNILNDMLIDFILIEVLKPSFEWRPNNLLPEDLLGT